MPRKAKAPKAAAAAPSLEAEKENVTLGATAPIPKSPPVRAIASKGLNTGRNWEEELEAMTQKLKKMSLEKEDAERRLQEQEATIKEQQEQLELKIKEQEKLQEKVKKMGKIKPFVPTLTMPVPDCASDDEGSKKKKKSDPDRLKRPASAYLLWCNDNRPKVRSENPNANFKETNAVLGDMWKNVSDDEKRKYEEEYQKNKAAYSLESSKQKRDAEGIQLLQSEQSKQCAMEVYEQYLEYQKELIGDLKSKKKEKDPEKPKKPQSAFLIFSSERRPSLTGKNLKFAEIAKVLGDEWKSLSAEEKAHYEKIASEGKANYADELEAYNQKKSEENKIAEESLKERAEMDRVVGQRLLKMKEEEAEIRKTLKAAKAPASRKAKAPKSTLEAEKEKTKRAPSAYNLFGKEYREKIKVQRPNANFGEIVTLTAAKWKELSADEKKRYTDMAAAAKENLAKEIDLKRIDPDSGEETTTSSDHQ